VERRAEGDRPAVTPAEAAELLAALRGAQPRLARRSSDSILTALARVVDGWLEPDSFWRRSAEYALPAAAGFSLEMIRDGLPLMIEPLRAPAVARLLDMELGDRAVLDRWVGSRRAVSPALVVQIMSGNIPGLAATAMVLGLAVKSAVLIKAAAGDQVFPELFAKSIAEVDDDLGACVAACYWRGGDHACENLVLAAADLVVAFGSDEALTDLRGRCPVRFFGHGHKVSFAAIAREILYDDGASRQAAGGLADDVALWDQRGCLSPHVCFVEGDFSTAARFARLLAPELEARARRWPPGALTTDEQQAIHRFRDEAEWQGLNGKTVELLISAAPFDWTIVIENGAAFRPTPLHRCVRLLPVADLDRLPDLLAGAKAVVEGAGIAAPVYREPEIRELLARTGAHWIATLGQMQRPTLCWPQGGRPRIADWVRWSASDTHVEP
jgi:hypothetical protein